MADKNTKATIEIGTTGLKRYGGQIQEEFLTELRGVRGVRVYEEMRKNDPTIGGVLRATIDTIRAVKWEVTPASGSPEDMEAAEFLEQCMDDMSMSWEDVISEALTMLPFGWAYMEVVLKLREGMDKDPSSKYNDGRLGWRKIALRGQDTLHKWDIDETGGIRAMIQSDPNELMGGKRVPIEKSLLFRTTREKNNPEGASLLRTAYRAWYFKKQLEEVEAIGIERDLTGLPVLRLPNGSTQEDVTKAKEILEKLKSDETGGLILPKGASDDGRQDWDFELQASPGNKGLDTNQVISRHTGEMAVAFLAQFLRLGMTRVGSYALSRDHKDLFSNSITSMLDNIEATLNRFLVPRLFALNAFSIIELPKFKHTKVGERDINTFANALRVMADTGLLGPIDVPLIQFIRGELDMPHATVDGDGNLVGFGSETDESDSPIKIAGKEDDPKKDEKTDEVTSKTDEKNES